jgi:hypothetical protein
LTTFAVPAPLHERTDVHHHRPLACREGGKTSTI